MQEIKKYRLKLTKTKALKFISHLDWQGLVLKIFRRCEISLVLSQGFNKMPKVSYSPALPIFIESDCELVNFQTYDDLGDSKDDSSAKEFLEKFAKNSPEGLEIKAFQKQGENETRSLENFVQWAKYEAKIRNSDKNFEHDIYKIENIRYIIEKCLSSDEFLIEKKTKKGIQKSINYRNSLKTFEADESGLLRFTLKAGQNETIPSLRADEFLSALFKDNSIFQIKRTGFLDVNLKEI